MRAKKELLDEKDKYGSLQKKSGSELLEGFRTSLEGALDEEDLERYLVVVRSRNGRDLKCFDAATEKRMKIIFDTLIKDSESHVSILKRLIKECEN